MKKKKIVFFLLFCLFAGPFPVYGAESAGDVRLRVVATIFPEYDWVREVLGDSAQGVDVTLLLDNGVDLHNYQPTVDDMVKIAACDLFIYVGGESDKWVEDALKNVSNEGRAVLKLLEVLGPAVKNEERVEGMEEEAHEHEGHKEHDGHEHEAEADEHVWLSLRNAEVICRRIAEVLSGLDPQHGEVYAANAGRYCGKLSELDRRYREAVDGAARRVVLFGDRFPFRYLADDYGLEYYAAFAGCSAETEASFATVMFLANKAEELALPCVLTIEGTRHKIAETVVASAGTKNRRVLSMDSMQSTTLKDAEGGATYLSVMEKNLETLRTALN